MATVTSSKRSCMQIAPPVPPCPALRSVEMRWRRWSGPTHHATACRSACSMATIARSTASMPMALSTGASLMGPISWFARRSIFPALLCPVRRQQHQWRRSLEVLRMRRATIRFVMCMTPPAISSGASMEWATPLATRTMPMARPPASPPTSVALAQLSR